MTRLLCFGFLACAIAAPVRADPEMNRLKADYEAALVKLLQVRVKEGNVNEAQEVRREIERLTGKPYQDAAAATNQPSTQAQADQLFVGKTWRTPTGTKFNFAAGGTGSKVFGTDKPAGIRWRHLNPTLVDVESLESREHWYFRFISLTEAYYGNKKESTKTKLLPE